MGSNAGLFRIAKESLVYGIREAYQAEADQAEADQAELTRYNFSFGAQLKNRVRRYAFRVLVFSVASRPSRSESPGEPSPARRGCPIFPSIANDAFRPFSG